MHHNVPQFGWGMLHYGIRESGSNIRLVWAKADGIWKKMCCCRLVCEEFGGK